MQQSHHADGTTGITPLDPALLRSPIDYLHAVHWCERELCAILERIAACGRASPAETDAATAFLAEELDLFPLLRLRCAAEDEIHRLLDRLRDDHRHATFDTPRVVHILRSATSQVPPTDGEELRWFADHAKRHLILENAILIPFARLRLTKADLDMLRASMRRRRGL